MLVSTHCPAGERNEEQSLPSQAHIQKPVAPNLSEIPEEQLRENAQENAPPVPHVQPNPEPPVVLDAGVAGQHDLRSCVLILIAISTVINSLKC